MQRRLHLAPKRRKILRVRDFRFLGVKVVGQLVSACLEFREFHRELLNTGDALILAERTFFEGSEITLQPRLRLCDLRLDRL